jgi:hypothetical protein
MNVKMALTDLDNGMSRDGLMELTNYDIQVFVRSV